MDLVPPILFKIESEETNIVKAPPIPTKPLAIPLHEEFPNSENASESFLQASAKAITAILVFNDIFNPLINLRDVTNDIKPTPIPNKPFETPAKSNFDIFSIAVDNIFIAVEIVINVIPALTIPLESKEDKDFVIDLKLKFNIVSITPIVVSDFAIFVGSILDIDFKAIESIPTAEAIVNKVVTLIPVVKDSKES